MQTYVRRLALIVIYVFCLQFAFLAFIQNPGIPEHWTKARLPAMVDGTAYRPFVYRTLLPTTVRLLESLLPEAVGQRLTEAARPDTPLGELLAATPAPDEQQPVTYLLAYVLEFGCLLGFALSLRAGVRWFYPRTSWVMEAIAPAALIGLPVFYRYISHDYDLPQLFLFTLCLLLLARRQWYAFYPLLVLAGLSKETSVLLVMIHVLGHWGTLRREALLAHAAVQLLILAGVRAVLQFVVFADNPGQPVEMHLARNWGMLADPSRWGFLFFHFHWVGRTAMIYPTNFNLLFLLGLPLILWRWSAKPLFLRRALWIAVPLLVLAFIPGQFDEMRVYYEVYPVLVLLAAHTLLTLSARGLECPA